jgi:hypothetical protein
MPGNGGVDWRSWEGGVLKVGYSFFQRLGALGRHLVTEEGDLRCSEDTLCQVDEDAVLLKSFEVSP